MGFKKGGKHFFYLLTVGAFLTYSWSFFAYSLSFFAYSPLRCFLDTPSRCKQRSSIVSKTARVANKKAQIVSKKAPKHNCKQKSSAVSRELPTVRINDCIHKKWEFGHIKRISEGKCRFSCQELSGRLWTWAKKAEKGQRQLRFQRREGASHFLLHPLFAPAQKRKACEAEL